jgi:vacuolar-type H+-ATPase subunit H
MNRELMSLEDQKELWKRIEKASENAHTIGAKRLTNSREKLKKQAQEILEKRQQALSTSQSPVSSTNS